MQIFFIESKNYFKDQNKVAKSILSNNYGRFELSNIPCGDYVIVPIYKGETTKYDLVPSQQAFSVSANSVILPERFAVVGFSVLGQIVDIHNNGTFSFPSLPFS